MIRRGLPSASKIRPTITGSQSTARQRIDLRQRPLRLRPQQSAVAAVFRMHGLPSPVLLPINGKRPDFRISRASRADVAVATL